MDLNQLSTNLFVGAQIAPEDLEHLAREGFTDVVCNRPDAEHLESAGSRVMASIAANLGLDFHYLPIEHGEPFHAQSNHLARLASRPEAKVLAYCRSGARSANSWTLAQSEPAQI